MGLNPTLVEALVRGGLSAVCATCNRYWEGRDRGLPEPQCTARTRCGSPMVGDDFHEYDGPMRLDEWCFVCAQSSRYGVRARGRPRVVGVCEKHVRLLSSIQPVEAPAVKPVIVDKDGSSLRESMEPKSLLRAIAESEAEFEKAGK